MIYDGKKISTLREGRGWNMAELARRSKISQPSLWSLEHQRTKKPKADTLMRIAAALGVNLQSILSGNQKGENLAGEMSSLFQGLTPENQAALVAAAQSLLKSQK